jgi:hypothetical protein
MKTQRLSYDKYEFNPLFFRLEGTQKGDTIRNKQGFKGFYTKLKTTNMAAAQVRAALQLIGFAAPAAQAITDQGHDDFEELSLLTDDEVDGLCKSLRSPGGTVPGVAVAAGAAPAPAVPNPGMAVSTRAQNNLKLMCYYFRFCQRCSDPIVAANITLANIRALRGQRTLEEDHEDPTAPTIEGEDWPKIIDTLLEYLGACLGVTKIPLAYVVRDDTDPGDEPAVGWASNEEAMITRGPIMTVGANPAYTNDFKVDNKAVWLLLAGICREHGCWAYIRSFQRRQDGRAAFLALTDHYLGSSNLNTMAARAMHKLTNTTYTGERRRWNWESFVRVHVEQHAVLEDLKQHGHSGIDEGSKVRYLMAGVRTEQLDTVKASILGNLDLLTDFTAASSLYKAFIDSNNATRARDRDITIAGVGVGDDDSVSSETASGSNTSNSNGNDRWKNVKPDMSVEERFYNRNEYRQLTEAQKAGLIAKRAAREGGKKKATGKRGRRGGRGGVRKSELSNRAIAKLATALRGSTLGPDSDDGADSVSSQSSGEETVPMKPAAKTKKQKIISNRENPALQRKKK